MKESEDAGRAGASVPAPPWRLCRPAITAGLFVLCILGPAALAAIARILESRLLPPEDGDADMAARARRLAATWEETAPPLFRVEIPGPPACRRLAAFARAQGLPPLRGCDPGRPRRFAALALDKDGRAVPVIHSDVGLALLFRDPPQEELELILDTALQPFPQGLLSPVGLLVAHPGLAPAEIAGSFTRTHYHGMVVWSWQQAVMAQGLARQLARDDLPAALRARLERAQERLWAAIRATRREQANELWSWTWKDGRMRVAPFRPALGHRTESNAIQLWSTVFLALRPPEARRR